MKKQKLRILKLQQISGLFILLLVFAAFQACENSGESSINNSKQGTVSYTGCKNSNLKSTYSEGYDPSITIQTIDSVYLSIEHINAVLNCVFDSLTINCFIEDSLITIYEKQINPNAYCTCNYDIEYQIGPLMYEKTYSIIIFDESLNNDEISFDFKFTENTHMTFY